MKQPELFKKLSLAVAMLAIATSGWGQALIVENFDYPVGAALTAHGWAAHSSAGTNAITVSTPTITYPGYLGSGIGNQVTLTTSGEDVNRTFAPQTSGTVYASFLVNVTSANTAGDYFFHVGATTISTTFRGRVFASRNAENKLAFGIAQSTTPVNYSAFVYDLNTTYLVVLRYEIIAGATNDAASIFINPPLNAPIPTSGWITNTDAAGTDLAQLGSVALRQGASASAPALILDGMRVSTNWADIVGEPVAATPTLSVSPTSLTGFGYAEGSGPSAAQTFVITANALTPTNAPVSIYAPANFLVSLDGSTWGAFQSVDATGGSLSQTVHVRLLSGLSAGSYSGSVNISGGGATAVSVAVSGSVSAAITEPTNHVTGFAASTNITPTSIALTWTDAVPAADGYLIIGATGTCSGIANPVDGAAQANAALIHNVAAGIQTHTFGGLAPNTLHCFKIFPYNGSGAGINYKTDGVVPEASATTLPPTITTYSWIGAEGASWQVDANWSPARTTPQPTDILQFDGGAARTVTAVPGQTIGQMRVINNTAITLQAAAADNILVISGGTDTDLVIEAGSQLNVSGTTALQISLSSGATGSISGSMTFANGVHRLLSANASGITFNSGSQFTAGTGFTGNAFGTTSLNSVIFSSGSAYILVAGSNPFGATQPSSVVVFQAGSNYIHRSVGIPAFAGRTYANFEYDHTGTISPLGASAVSMENLKVTKGTLNFNVTGTPGHSIKGNIEVMPGATLNFDPSTVGTVNLNGTAMQTISGGGTITAGTRSTLASNNASGVRLSTAATFNNLTIMPQSFFDFQPGTSCTVSGTLTNGNTGIAETVGADDTSNYSAWTNGSNGGSGFGPWSLWTQGTGGHFLASSSAQGFGNIDTGGRSFGMWGNPAGTNFSHAQRTFTGWADGSTFSIDIAVAFRNGAKGIDLFASGFESIWNFNVGGDQYSAGGSNLAWAYSQTSIFKLTATQVGANINITLTRGTDTYSTTIIGKTLHAFRLYVGGTDAGNDSNNLFFNNLKVTRPALGATGLIIRNGGSLLHGTPNVGATMERTMPGAPNATSYRLVSAPVSGMAIYPSAWASTLPNTTYDLFWFKENVAPIGDNYFPWINIRAAGGGHNANFGTNFESGRGYLARYNEGGTKAFVGMLNAGVIAIDVTRTETTSTAIKGWNLIGNPYPSAINWALADKSLFSDDFAYIYDPTFGGGGGGYRPESGLIAPHQGFFVTKASPGSSTFTFTNTIRTHGGTWLKNEPARDMIGLKLTRPDIGFFDETTLMVIEGSLFVRDRQDALKLFSFNPQMPQLFTQTSNNVMVAINSVPQIEAHTQVTVGVEIPAAGQYTIGIDHRGGLFQTRPLYLTDNVTGLVHDLGQNTSVSFAAEAGSAPARFTLKFAEPTGIETVADTDTQVYVWNNLLTINFANAKENRTLHVFDTGGRLVMSHQLGSQTSHSLPINLNSGVYLVRITSPGTVFAQRIVVR